MLKRHELVLVALEVAVAQCISIIGCQRSRLGVDAGGRELGADGIDRDEVTSATLGAALAVREHSHHAALRVQHRTAAVAGVNDGIRAEGFEPVVCTDVPHSARRIDGRHRGIELSGLVEVGTTGISDDRRHLLHGGFGRRECQRRSSSHVSFEHRKIAFWKRFIRRDERSSHTVRDQVRTCVDGAGADVELRSHAIDT